MRKIIALVLVSILMLSTLIACAPVEAIDTSYTETDTINGVKIDNLNGYQYDDINNVYLLDFSKSWQINGYASISAVNSNNDVFEVENITNNEILLKKTVTLYWVIPVESLDIATQLGKIELEMEDAFFNFSFIPKNAEKSWTADTSYGWVIDEINAGRLESEIELGLGYQTAELIINATRVDQYEIVFNGEKNTIRIERSITPSMG